jgi:hydroxypyruvate isomerase
MKAAICLEMVFPEVAPHDRVTKIAAAGFDAVEFWGWRDKDLAALKGACKLSGVRVANFSAHRKGSLVEEAGAAAVLADLGDAAAAAADLGCPMLMLLTNELGEGGRVLNSYPGLSRERKLRNVVAGLKRVMEKTPRGLELVLEPLNTRIDHVGYFLEDMATAVAIVREVGDSRLRVLCDLYHLAVMGENPVEIVDRYLPFIGHFHAADVPGRHEPGTGGLDWVAILRRIRDQGFSGTVGFEYAPRGDSAASLDRIRETWSRATG